MTMKLYVGGLTYDVTDEELKQLFTEQGKVASATIIKDRFSGQSKGFGFVEMEDIKEGQGAIKALDGKELKGRTLVVNQARPQEERRPQAGGRGFRPSR